MVNTLTKPPVPHRHSARPTNVWPTERADTGMFSPTPARVARRITRRITLKSVIPEIPEIPEIARPISWMRSHAIIGARACPVCANARETWTRNRRLGTIRNDPTGCALYLVVYRIVRHDFTLAQGTRKKDRADRAVCPIPLIGCRVTPSTRRPNRRLVARGTEVMRSPS